MQKSVWRCTTRPVMLRVLPLLLLVACGVGSPTPQEVLDRTVYTYNQHLRWKRFDKASRFVADAARVEFMKRFEGADEDLNIEDLEVKEVAFETDVRAKVTIEVRFFKLPNVTVQKHKWHQIWLKKGEDDWWLEENVFGPFFPDASSKPSSAPVKSNG